MKFVLGEERFYGTKKEILRTRPNFSKFTMCCHDARVKLPTLNEAPECLNKLLDYEGEKRSKSSEIIRIYNLTFVFLSMGGIARIQPITDPQIDR